MKIGPEHKYLEGVTFRWITLGSVFTLHVWWEVEGRREICSNAGECLRGAG